jgi:hypothetical protein
MPFILGGDVLVCRPKGGGTAVKQLPISDLIYQRRPIFIHILSTTPSAGFGVIDVLNILLNSAR